ncbi:MAG: hypothetical protein E6Q97_08450 [Desulfurellales bacterium]|nr:MAG: hypothetical protein E6Q97_08450 [Desulfurellales bacterium]
MKLEQGKCAECGRKLSTGYETDSHNTALDKFASPHRPYFCSAECVDRAITTPVNTALDEWDDFLNESRTYGDKAAEEWEKIKSFRDQRPATFKRKFDSAAQSYFNDYFAAFAEREAERNAEELAKAHEKFVKEEAKATAQALARAERFQEKEAARLAAEQEKVRLAEIEAEKLKPIPLQIPSDHSRFEGVHVLGPAGSGKTTLAQEFIIHDILRDDSPALIILDPKGTLVDRVKRLDVIDPDRLVIIDATHPHPAKLGLFVKSANPAVNAEQIVNQAISTYRYIFEASNFSFTAKQSILFENVVRLMFETGGTLSSLIDFLRRYHPKRAGDFADMLGTVTPDLREFFQYDFPDSYESTAKEINVRLQQIKQKPILRAMFDTTERHVDFFDCIQNGKIVLVNSGMSLDPDTSRMIGRFVIAMVLNAVYVRATMPKSEWCPAFMLIDEFQEFVDVAKTPELLRFPREYNFGTMVLHHNMYATEIDEAVRVAISTNTGIKFCADPRGMDLNYMARDFFCEPEFLRRQQVNDTHVHFAHVMRRKYNTPVSVRVRRGNIEELSQRTEAEVAELDRENVAKVHTGPVVKFISEDEWIDLAQAGYLDEDTGKMYDRNIIYKIDKSIQRYHVGSAVLSQPAPSTTSPSPSPTLPKPGDDRPEDW